MDTEKLISILMSPNVKPEDVFGLEITISDLHGTFVNYARLVHPDLHVLSNDKRATKAMQQLTVLYNEAETLLQEGLYGKPRGATIKTRKSTYHNVNLICGGDICDVYRARAGDDDSVIIKVLRNLKDRDLFNQEILTLAEFDSQRKKLPKLVNRVPKVIESTTINIGGIEKPALILKQRSGEWYTLRTILNRNGKLDIRDAAWMWRRLLEALFLPMLDNRAHCGVTADHLLLRPKNHAGILLDWSYSTRVGDKPVAVPSGVIAPPEFKDGYAAHASSDVWMASYVLEEMTDDKGEDLQRFLKTCRLSKAARYPDAHAAYEAFGKLLHHRYGAPTFRQFKINPNN